MRCRHDSVNAATDLRWFMSPMVLAFKLFVTFLNLLRTLGWESWVHSNRLHSAHHVFHKSIRRILFQSQFTDVYLLIQSTQSELIFEISVKWLWIRLLHMAKEGTLACAETSLEPWGCWLGSWCIVLLVFQLSQGIAGPTIRSGVNYLYFSSVLISIRLLWKPYLTSFLDLCYCSQALVKVNKNIRLLSVLLLATSCQQSTNSLTESFGNLTWLFMQSIARLVCIHNCLILWPLL